MKGRIYLIACLILVLIINYTSLILATEQSLSEQKEELQNEIDVSTENLENIQDNIEDVQNKINEFNEQILAMKYEIADLNVKIAQCELDLETAQKNLNTAEQEYEEQKALLEKRLVSTYETGDTAFLDVLLGASSIGDFLSKYYLLTEIIKYDDELLTLVETEKENIKREKETFEIKLDELENLKYGKQTITNELNLNMEKRKTYLNELTEKEKQIQEDIEKYEKEMENLESQILRASISASTSGSDGTSNTMIWPMPGADRVTSMYGMRVHPLFGMTSMHTGVDIAAFTGTPIIAANGGVVILSTYSSSYGNYIMINHGGGVVTLYAHASQLIAKVGDVVEQGDIIMLNGSTGWSTGPHLHFEIRINGSAVDPYPYIQTTTSYIDE